jgi:hypothetical protein
VTSLPSTESIAVYGDLSPNAYLGEVGDERRLLIRLRIGERCDLLSCQESQNGSSHGQYRAHLAVAQSEAERRSQRKHGLNDSLNADRFFLDKVPHGHEAPPFRASPALIPFARVCRAKSAPKQYRIRGCCHVN